MSIEIRNLTKRFCEKAAVDNLSLTIEGGMYGLLGPNGAGKTTLMRMLCTLLTPTSGEAQMDGIALTQHKQVRRAIGYLPQDFSFYPQFTVYETLDYLALLSEMKDSAQRRKRILELLELTNLARNHKTKVRQLSGGMLRRLGIAQVLLANPPIVIVDEPTAGLDPEERIRFRNLLGTLAGNKTVLLSTHIAEDILQTCPNVAVMNEGKLLYAGSVRELTQRAQGHIWRVCVDRQAMESLQKKHAVIATVLQADGYDMRILSAACPWEGARQVAPGLEDAYMLLVKGGRNV